MRQSQRERDEALVKEHTLEKRVRDLEAEAEKNALSKEEKSRHVKLMEVHKLLMTLLQILEKTRNILSTFFTLKVFFKGKILISHNFV